MQSSLEHSEQFMLAEFSKMEHLSHIDRARALGHVQAGIHQAILAARFGVSQGTINNLMRMETNDVKDKVRGG